MTRDVGVYIAGNITYVSGTVNGKAYIWTLSGDHVWSTAVDRSADDVYEVFIEAINSAGTVIQLSTTIYYGLHLITDRPPVGSYYNASDLNRVGAAFEFLRDKMNGEYGFALDPIIKTNWTTYDIPTQNQMEEYSQNVVDIRNSLTLPASAPQAPESMRFLTAEKANDIEKILQAVENTLNLMKQAWNYSGELYSGEA